MSVAISKMFVMFQHSKSESKVVPAGARAGLPRPPSTGHRRQLLLANQREEREISKLEKLLRMKRRKNLPASFRDEGLDCIHS